MADKRARASHLRWVQIGDLHVSPRAQRAFRKLHAEGLAANFDLEALGFPVVSHRAGQYWIVDGQHRVAALKYVGFSDDDLIQVECYEGLTEAEEAQLFLRRDERRRISTFDRFRIASVAERDEELDIERIVRAQGYRIEQGRSDGAIGAVEALRFAYKLGPATLRRALRILGESFDGDPSAFTAELIKGMALVCQRYNGALNDERAVQRLSGLTGGPITLKRKTEALKLRTGHNKQQCAAGAIVETLNAGRGGIKLESWWA
jgi:hypothetical protein